MMISAGYVSPFVPPEWIAAHGLRPEWLALDCRQPGVPQGAHRGLCPYAGALIAEALSGTAADLLVLATTCDPMRYAAAFLWANCSVPTFLLNVPSTWQLPQSRELYREELERLGGFLVARGGRSPTAERLIATVQRYDEQRAVALKACGGMPPGRWARTLSALRGALSLPCDVERPAVASSSSPGEMDVPARQPETAGDGCSSTQGDCRDTGPEIPLALVGGPQAADHAQFLDLVSRAGGRVVLDASEGGERTLPGPIDRHRLAADPLGELVRAYFDTIPDVFRRPNTLLYEWLAEQLPARGVRGILFRRYLFCDLWNAELHCLRERSGLPVLAIDVASDDDRETDRSLGRIEAFLETLTL
ncbi:MAG: 2-hydroxyacyl-CoA dehydratase family protein [Thermoguttaceae bacterium]|jgi:benzoyl-CoA reductase/2-hydroxyglutaryl-CoA dehydratase subunit BcrC/BadD/HgdB|nr:2-hydroxyacyl-CoA dehydratase family protein [Thermoguttaceae bacterium]